VGSLPIYTTFFGDQQIELSIKIILCQKSKQQTSQSHFISITCQEFHLNLKDYPTPS
jgi:hypothetical protein